MQQTDVEDSKVVHKYSIALFVAFSATALISSCDLLGLLYLQLIEVDIEARVITGGPHGVGVDEEGAVIIPEGYMVHSPEPQIQTCDTIRVAFWNIRQLGEHPTDQKVAGIAETIILSGIDIVGFQEIRKNGDTGLRAIRDALEEYGDGLRRLKANVSDRRWVSGVTDECYPEGVNSCERYGYLWDNRRLNRRNIGTGIRGPIPEDWGKYPRILRPPYFQGFGVRGDAANKFNFYLTQVHTRPTPSDAGAVVAGFLELNLIGLKDVVVGGDFNFAPDKAPQSLKGLNSLIETHHFDPPGSLIQSERLVDNIYFGSHTEEDYAGVSGLVKFDVGMKIKDAWIISDHRPVFADFCTAKDVTR